MQEQAIGLLFWFNAFWRVNVSENVPDDVAKFLIVVWFFQSVVEAFLVNDFHNPTNRVHEQDFGFRGVGLVCQVAVCVDPDEMNAFIVHRFRNVAQISDRELTSPLFDDDIYFAGRRVGGNRYFFGRRIDIVERPEFRVFRRRIKFIIEVCLSGCRDRPKAKECNKDFFHRLND